MNIGQIGLLNRSLVKFAVLAAASSVFLSSEALATGSVTYNCSDLAGGLQMPPNSGNPQITLAEGNILTVVSDTAGTFNFGTFGNYGIGTTVAIVGPGQAGNWELSTRVTTESIHLTCNLSGDEVAEAGAQMMASNAARVFSDGVHTTIADRFAGRAFSNGVSTTANGFSAYASTSRMKAPDVLMAYGDDGSQIGIDTGEESAWNAWLRAEGTGFDGDGDTDVDGWAAQMAGGIDYRVAENVIVGLLFGFERADFEFDSNFSEFEGEGPSLGAYVGLQIADGIVLDATVAHSWLNYDINNNGVTGDFEASRWLFAANLVGQYYINDRVMLQPGVRIVYATEEQESYTLSNALMVDDKTVSSGSASFGTKIYYNLAEDMPAGSRVWISLNGNYDFSDEEITSTTLPDFDGVFSGRVGAGLQTSIFDTASLSVSGEVSGLGSNEYLAYGGNLKVAVPLGGH